MENHSRAHVDPHGKSSPPNRATVEGICSQECGCESDRCQLHTNQWTRLADRQGRASRLQGIRFEISFINNLFIPPCAGASRSASRRFRIMSSIDYERTAGGTAGEGKPGGSGENFAPRRTPLRLPHPHDPAKSARTGSQKQRTTAAGFSLQDRHDSNQPPMKR